MYLMMAQINLLPRTNKTNRSHLGQFATLRITKMQLTDSKLNVCLSKSFASFSWLVRHGSTQKSSVCSKERNDSHENRDCRHFRKFHEAFPPTDFIEAKVLPLSFNKAGADLITHLLYVHGCYSLLCSYILRFLDSIIR